MVVKCINVVLRGQKVKKSKGQAIGCAVLGAALSAAQKERYTNKGVEGKNDWMPAGSGEKTVRPVK